MKKNFKCVNYLYLKIIILLNIIIIIIKLNHKTILLNILDQHKINHIKFLLRLHFNNERINYKIKYLFLYI